ncbi:MAG: sialidase family protein [Myxococcales bacterium]|nr:glycoside hydrolase [Polyangiaceae bacterium]MDW8251733.1 sialidase family protein [Myxococcales bacterium]
MLLATYPSTSAAKLTWTGASPPLFEAESASAVIPPGVDPIHCPEGRLFMGHGRSDAVAGVARRVDRLSLLDDPQASILPGPVRAASIPVGNQIVDEYPAMPTDTVPVGEKICVDGSCFCEFTGTVPRFLRGATDTFTVRAGTTTILQMVAAMGYRMGDVDSDCQPVPYRAVNILRRSTDCGRSWTTSILNAEGFEDTFYSNADLPFMYVDRNNPERVFVAGGSGPPLGGVQGLLVWRSDDNGRTWTPRFSPKVKGRHVLFSSHALTTTSEGIVVLAGCGVSTSEANDAPLLVYYSLNHGDDWFGPVVQPSSVSNCGRGYAPTQEC